MTDERHPVDLLAEEFAEAIRAGQRPSIEQYTAQYPEHADLIRSLFPSIERMERAREHQSSRDHPSANAKSFVTPTVPASLGDFRIVREIGRGGMGLVFEAEQQSLGRRVALKVMTQSGGESSRSRERFRREAEAAATLHHTNVVAIFGTGEDQGLLYYAMQLIDGVALNQVIAALRVMDFRLIPQVLHPHLRGVREAIGEAQTQVADAPTRTVGESHNTSVSSSGDASVEQQGLEVPAAPLQATSEIASGHDWCLPSYFRVMAQMVAEAASGLEHAHQHGILHRDIKPSNLMLDHEGTVWITDFGVAKQSQLEDVTYSGEVVGTLRYMAPEQLKGNAGPQSDIFSLALVLYELLTRRAAVTSTSEQWLASISSQRIARPSEHMPGIPRDLEVILLKALAPEPEERYATAGLFAEDLRRFVEDRPILARPESAIRRIHRLVRRNPALATTTAATVLLLAVIAGMLGWFNHEQSKMLAATQLEYNRAETNLREKTSALAEADRQRARAAGNLDMALQAFSEVVANIGSRGGAEAILDELQEDPALVSAADAGLSDADIKLLEQLLHFFDRFAESNAADLSADLAAAQQSVGDIHQRLGNSAEARVSYDAALKLYRQLAERDPDEPEWILSQVQLLQEQMVVAAENGQAGRVARLFSEAIALLSNYESVRLSREGRFVEAKICTTLSSLGTKSFAGALVRNGPRGRLGNRFAIEDDESIRAERLQREADANQRADDLLRSLLDEDPGNVSYRLAMVRAQCDRARIAIMQSKRAVSQRSMTEAISMMEKLTKEFPESQAFQFELADTLRASAFIFRGETKQLQRALEISDKLIREFPDSTDNRILRSSILIRLAEGHMARDELSGAIDRFGQAMEDQQVLVDRQPEVALYQVALVRTMLRLVDAHRMLGQPSQALELLDDVLEQFSHMRNRQTRGPAGQMRVRGLIQRLQEVRNELAN